MEKVTKKLFFTVLLLLALENNVYSEDVDLERIVVTSSRTEEYYDESSRQIDVLTSKNIEKSRAEDVSEVLTDLTSVNISSNGGIGGQKTIRMRGSTAAQVLVLVDGRPVNSPRDGTIDLNNIPLDNIERIEVMHGPGSSLYGSQAMGGVVQIITKKPPKEGHKTEFTTSFGTFRTYLERLLHGAKIANFSYLISGQYQSSEGARENSMFNGKDLNAKMEYQLNGQNKLTLNSGFLKNRIGVPGPKNYPDKDNKQVTLDNFIDTNWNFTPDSDTQINAKLYNNYDRLEYNENSIDYFFETGDKFIHTTKVRGIDFNASKKLQDSFSITAGINYVANFNDSTSSAKHKYSVLAEYLNTHLDIGKKLSLDLGARIDDYSNFGSDISPNLSVLYKISENTKLRGLVAQSFRAPTFNDLYWPNTGYERGNPDLRPEKGTTGEVGIETKLNERIITCINYSRSHFKRLIQWQPESADPLALWQPTNIGSAIIDTIEYENRFLLTRKFELDLGYTFLKAKDAKQNTFLIYQPEHKLDCSLKYKDELGFSFEINGQFVDRVYADAANTSTVKRSLVFNLTASKKFKNGITCFSSIRNLLNRKYEVNKNFPMPGFSITNGVKFEF